MSAFASLPIELLLMILSYLEEQTLFDDEFQFSNWTIHTHRSIKWINTFRSLCRISYEISLPAFGHILANTPWAITPMSLEALLALSRGRLPPYVHTLCFSNELPVISMESLEIAYEAILSGPSRNGLANHNLKDPEQFENFMRNYHDSAWRYRTGSQAIDVLGEIFRTLPFLSCVRTTTGGNGYWTCMELAKAGLGSLAFVRGSESLVEHRENPLHQFLSLLFVAVQKMDNKLSAFLICDQHCGNVDLCKLRAPVRWLNAERTLRHITCFQIALTTSSSTAAIHEVITQLFRATPRLRKLGIVGAQYESQWRYLSLPSESSYQSHLESLELQTVSVELEAFKTFAALHPNLRHLTLHNAHVVDSTDPDSYLARWYGRNSVRATALDEMAGACSLENFNAYYMDVHLAPADLLASIAQQVTNFRILERVGKRWHREFVRRLFVNGTEVEDQATIEAEFEYAADPAINFDDAARNPRALVPRSG